MHYSRLDCVPNFHKYSSKPCQKTQLSYCCIAPNLRPYHQKQLIPSKKLIIPLRIISQGEHTVNYCLRFNIQSAGINGLTVFLYEVFQKPVVLFMVEQNRWFGSCFCFYFSIYSSILQLIRIHSCISEKINT